MSEPVLMNISVVMIDAPKDIKAVWAVQQVLDGLKLGKTERENVLKFLLKKSRLEEVPF